MAKVDEDGYLYIVARKKEIIKVGGKRVSPKEIEEVILSVPEVLDCSIQGFEDEILGEGIKATIVLSHKLDKNLMKNKILRHCSQNLALYKVPQKVHFEEFLKTSITGKKTK
jgi:acyl-coenzyme A synthetase/AMP-(fatty) acid ligase